jgi:hypothetical protein
MQPFHMTLEGFTDEYQSPRLINKRNEDFYLRLTGASMNPDESFFILVPAEMSRGRIQETLEYAFPASQRDRKDRKDNLEVDVYAELPALYDHFAGLIDEERRGEAVLDYSVNDGPAGITLDKIVDNHTTLSTLDETGESYKVLHLVVSDYPVPFTEYTDPADVQYEKKQARGLLMHYFIVNDGLNAISPAQYTGAVKEALDYCQEQNLVILNRTDSRIELKTTDQSDRFISTIEGENEYYKNKYEQFAAVLVEEDWIEFDHDDGIDLRVAAMRYDGINPYRAVMIINMFNGAYDGLAKNWEEVLRDDKIFARYLGAAAKADIPLSEEQFELVMQEAE